MKTLIIHNNNISNIDKYTENISFTSINDVIKTLNNYWNINQFTS